VPDVTGQSVDRRLRDAGLLPDQRAHCHDLDLVNLIKQGGQGNRVKEYVTNG